MGKREVRIVVIRKPVTIALLVLVSAAMVALVWFLSGKTYARDTSAATDILLRLLRRDDPPRDALLAALMPVIANALLFMPWGFLAFIAIDKPARPRRSTYALTIATGVLFAAVIQVWQTFLPTRVSSPVDVVANAMGAFLGAMGGHLRKRVYVRFEH